MLDRDCVVHLLDAAMNLLAYTQQKDGNCAIFNWNPHFLYNILQNFIDYLHISSVLHYICCRQWRSQDLEVFGGGGGGGGLSGESTVASLLCLAMLKVSHKYILPVAFSVRDSIAPSVQQKEGVLEPPLPLPGYAPGRQVRVTS